MTCSLYCTNSSFWWDNLWFGMKWRVNRVLCKNHGEVSKLLSTDVLLLRQIVQKIVSIFPWLILLCKFMAFIILVQHLERWAALLSSLAQLPLVLVLRRSILRSGPLWQSDVEEGLALIGGISAGTHLSVLLFYGYYSISWKWTSFGLVCDRAASSGWGGSTCSCFSKKTVLPS